jgi:hypothetical protein
MLNLELCMLTCSHAYHGAFHGHLRDMEARLMTLMLTLEPWRLTVEPCMLTLNSTLQLT